MRPADTRSLPADHLGSLRGTLVGVLLLDIAQSLGAQIDPAFTLLAGRLIFLGASIWLPRGLCGALADCGGPALRLFPAGYRLAAAAPTPAWGSPHRAG